MGMEELKANGYQPRPSGIENVTPPKSNRKLGRRKKWHME